MKNVKIVNLTPHTVNLIGDGFTTEFPSEGQVRLSQQVKNIGMLNGIPLTSTVFGDVEGLPEQKEGVFYIVSRLVKTALKDRNDLVVPGEQVRDEEGRIVGCKSFSID